jgi:hypothetical protein
VKRRGEEAEEKNAFVVELRWNGSVVEEGKKQTTIMIKGNILKHAS